MDWLQMLPAEMIASARRAHGAPAWTRTGALAAAEILEEGGWQIVRVDVLVPTEPALSAPAPFIYDWFADAEASVQRHKTAKAFLQDFSWNEYDTAHAAMEPVFALRARKG